MTGKREKWITLKEAAMIMSGEGRTVKDTTLLYAINTNRLKSITIGGILYVECGAIEAMVLSGLTIPRLTEMIKRDLRQTNLWEPEWEKDWEKEEAPMTQEEFEEYERKRLIRMAFKPVQRKIWEM
jgi:hypothetical protein